MSKSKGDFLMVSLLEEKGYNPLAYRLMCMQSHYRKQLLFTYDALDNATSAYNKLLSKIKSLKDNREGDIEGVDIYIDDFKNSLADDLNTATSLTILYDALKSDLNNNSKLYIVSEFDKVLSLNLLNDEVAEISEETKKYIDEMIEKRNTAKKDKDFALADQIRDELASKNIFIKDTREGTTYEIKE
jgi:cysteinyl-tRNA synthetase